MAANGASFIKLQRNLHGFMSVLTSAACEWFLIFLLLIDAVLSFLLTKFALYCELEIPCILCARLDHILGNEKPEYYQDLLCSNHRLEISSLISCQIHDKLANGLGMCEDCLLSFTMKNKSHTDMHKLLVSKLGFDLGGCGFQSPMLKQDIIPGSMGMRSCSCCTKPWRSRQNAQKLLQLKSSGTGAVNKPNIPLPRRLSRRESLKKIRDKFSGSVTSRRLGKSGFDPLSHVGYTELKITSDSESEFPFSDDDDGSSLVREICEPKEETAVQCASEIPPKTLSNDLVAVKLTHHSSNTERPLIDPCMRPDVSEPCDVKCLASDVAIGHGLGELNWKQVDQKTYPSTLPELILLDDMPPSSNTAEVPVGASTRKCELKIPLSHNSNASALSELISLIDTPSSSPEKYVTGTTDVGHVSIIKNEEVLKSMTTTAGAGIKYDQGINEPASINLTNVDPKDVCKQAISSKERAAPGFVGEKLTANECDRVNEDSKALPAQNFSAQGIDLSSAKTTLVVQRLCDELQITDTSSSSGAQMLQESVSPERNGSSGLESLDGSIVSEIEGESIVDQLKRQVEYDQRYMYVLCKELEEERSASAIAANQAMAMITRLQEEKASLHMEALQYLRMMEEQAEYDVEALEKANDLLAEKEKDIQDMEAELEYYRLHFPVKLMAETMQEQIYDLHGGKVTVENTSMGRMKDDVNVPCNSMSTEVSKGSNKPFVVKSSCSEFEDEKLYISQCLKNLERKLHQFANHGGYSEEAVNGGHNQEVLSDDEGTPTISQTEEIGLSMQKDTSVSSGNLPAQEGLNEAIGEDQIVSKENNHPVSNRQKPSMHCREVDLAGLENEISDLNDRLEALEADFKFLEHTFNSLENGNEGLLFIQEIAHQLQELRKIGLRDRCRSGP